MSSEEFRKRYTKHNQSLNNPNYMNETTLSKKVWERKGLGLAPKPNFKILKLSKSYSAGDRSYGLCTDEKLEIILNTDKSNLLNSRKELFSKCRHKAGIKISSLYKRQGPPRGHPKQ